MKRKTILILFGGMAEEHDVSIKSVKEVSRALNAQKYRAIYVYITREGSWRAGDTPEDALVSETAATLNAGRDMLGLTVFLPEGAKRIQIDVAFPVLHGRYGEDGAIQGLLELSGIPYVGCGVAASAMAMDKSLAYLALKCAGVAVPRHWVILPGEEVPEGKWTYPVFVKPARSGSSFGVSKVYRKSGLEDAVMDARKYDGKVLIEEAVTGAEVGCAVLGNGNMLLTGEIDQIELSGGFFHIHQEKSPEQGSENAAIRVPANISPAARARALAAAKAVYRALGCRGLARVDMFLGKNDEITINEVNTMPGFTSYSRYPRMMRAAGIGMERLIDMLIALAEGEFVYLDEAVPGVIWDAKYFGADNFTGQRVDGYEVNRVVGTKALAKALTDVQARAKEKGLCLLLWDAYRPKRAVDNFVRWAKMPEDGKTKCAHYPNIDKSDMIPLGYVAEKSGHNRGGAVDLTLCDAATGKPLDMGGEFDLMDETSHHGAAGVSAGAAKNRETLKELMEACGFCAFESEWWHYSLRDEPYPDTVFDFPIA